MANRTSACVKSLDIFHIRASLRKPIKHALAARTATDNLVVRATLDDGTIGHGEGVPREYVTGDTIDSTYGALVDADYAPLVGSFGRLDQVVEFLTDYHPVGGVDPAGRLGNPARCAVELSLLDAFGRRFGRPLSDVTSITEEGREVAGASPWARYSGVVTAETAAKQWISAAKMRLYGFAQVKVKVAMPGVADGPRLGRIRRVLGRRIDVRVDANGGWTPDEAVERIAELAPLGVTSVEQPIPDADRDRLPAIRRASPVRIMLDESLCGWADARTAVEQGRCDLFNLRLSKCGGFLATLRLAALARRRGLGYQLGCQVGETGILSAAGRAFAASVRDIAYTEGSYDRHLVRDSLLESDITFGYGGWAPALRGPGLGVQVNAARLEAAAVRRHRVDL